MAEKKRAKQQYKLQACNSADICASSNIITLNDDNITPIAYFKASNPDNGDKFGEVVAVQKMAKALRYLRPMKIARAQTKPNKMS